MINIDINNFKDMKDKIIEKIDKSEFISIDSEFSNLLDNNINNFDSFEEIYHKYKNVIKKSSLFQLGITCISKLNNNNKREAISFNCYWLNENKKHEFYNKSLRFLSKNNFDFKRLFTFGIPFYKIFKNEDDIIKEDYSNNYNLIKLENQFNYNGTFFYSKNILNQEDILVNDWINYLEKNKESNFIKYEIIKKNDNEEFFNYLKNKKNKIKKIIEINNGNVSFKKTKIILKFKKMSKINLPEKIENENKNFFENENMELKIEGFEIIIREILMKNKNLVFHNPFLDLLYLFNFFVYELPDNFDTFLLFFNKIFKNIYDTKNLASELERKNNKIKSKNLEKLFIFSEKYYPIKSLLEFNNDGFNDYINFDYLMKENNLHNAGYDSLITGYIFLSFIDLFDKYKLNLNKNIIFLKGINYDLINDLYFKNHPRFINNSIIILLKINEKYEDIITKININYSFHCYSFQIKNNYLLLIKFLDNNINELKIEEDYVIYENRLELFNKLI